MPENRRTSSNGARIMIIDGIVLLAVGVVFAPLLVLALCSFSWRWTAAKIIMGAAFAAALVNSLVIMRFDVSTSILGWLRIDALASLVLLLISFIAWIVLRYAATNFEQDSSGKRFLWWFHATVFAVMCVVASRNLMLFWVAWVAISLSFHQLLMFYPDRPRAVLAAHKKFILARIAEICLAVAFYLLWTTHGTLNIDEILSGYPVQALGAAEHAAAILIALVALIKCAQLPVHGWLIQVVESPTSVSALLHAGVINLGGFLLILFAPLFSLSFAAQALVIVVAGMSMLVAALIMMTRISIKVRLAWSTNAQMGLMLVECALGLYELALLHMLAHSCYKAFAFLNSGEAVSDALRAQHRQRELPEPHAWLIAALIVVPSAGLFFLLSDTTLLPLSPWLIVTVALTVFIAQSLAAGGKQQAIHASSVCLLLLGSYVVLKTMLAPAVAMHEHPYRAVFDMWVVCLFAAQLLVYFQLQYKPMSTSSHRLFIALNAGFYLDEWLTRLTLKLWPINLPHVVEAESTNPQGVTQT
jgi:NAD(P)H-quinone oxidoreductase subunit 5